MKWQGRDSFLKNFKPFGFSKYVYLHFSSYRNNWNDNHATFATRRRRLFSGSYIFLKNRIICENSYITYQRIILVFYNCLQKYISICTSTFEAMSYRNNFKLSKIHIFWEGHKILRNLHLTFTGPMYRTKVRWRFRKILRPSQNIWTLTTLN